MRDNRKHLDNKTLMYDKKAPFFSTNLKLKHMISILSDIK